MNISSLWLADYNCTNCTYVHIYIYVLPLTKVESSTWFTSKEHVVISAKLGFYAGMSTVQISPVMMTRHLVRTLYLKGQSHKTRNVFGLSWWVTRKLINLSIRIEYCYDYFTIGESSGTKNLMDQKILWRYSTDRSFSGQDYYARTWCTVILNEQLQHLNPQHSTRTSFTVLVK